MRRPGVRKPGARKQARPAGRGNRPQANRQQKAKKSAAIKPQPATHTPTFEPDTPITLGFVRGIAPDKWRRRWHAVPSRGELLLQPIDAIWDPPSTSTVTLVRVQEGLRPKDSPGAYERHSVFLYTESLSVILPKDHELKAAPKVDADDLALLSFIGYPGYSPAWPAPIKWEEASYEPRSISQAMQLVSAGLGATIVPTPLSRFVMSKHEHTAVALEVDLEATSIFATWLVKDDTNRVQELVGVLKGRGSRSSR